MNEIKYKRKPTKTDITDQLDGEVAFSLKGYTEDNVSEEIVQAGAKIGTLIIQIPKGTPKGVTIKALRTRHYEVVKFDANIPIEYILNVIEYIGEYTRLVIPGDYLPDKAREIARALPAPYRSLYVALPLGDDTELMQDLAKKIRPNNSICLKHLNILTQNDIQTVLKEPFAENELWTPPRKTISSAVPRQPSAMQQRLRIKLKKTSEQKRQQSLPPSATSQGSVVSTNTVSMFHHPTQQLTTPTTANTDAKKTKGVQKTAEVAEAGNGKKNKKKNKHKKKEKSTSRASVATS